MTAVTLPPRTRHRGHRAAVAPVVSVLAVAVAMLPGGGSAGYGPLAMLPVVGLALFGTRRQLQVFLAGIAVAFPLLLLLGLSEGGEEVRWALLFLISAGIVAAGVERLMRRTEAEQAERELAHAELERARGRLEEAQAVAHLGSWEWDLASDHFTCSDELLRVYGVEPGTAVTSRFVLVDSVHEDDRAPVSVAMERAADAAEPFAFEHRIVRGDGELRWLHVTGRMIGDRPDRLAHVAGTARDVTRAHQAQEQLERSNDELERYAYVISHDLSEPVRVMAGFAKLLAERYEGRLDGDGQRFTGSIVTGAERMEDLIHALLEYSHVGSEEIDPVEVDLNELVSGVLDTLGTAIVEKRGMVTIEGELPTVQGDPVLLGQLLQNLIANALKFTGDEERPQVKLSASRRPGGFIFRVEDNGCGIDPRQADRIWEIFQRLHDRSHPGTGMGLAICKRIVERHGGRISVMPAPGGGSVFSFTLPRRPGMRAPLEPPAHEETISARRIGESREAQRLV